MKLNEFLEKLNKVLNSKTLYVMGCFGAPLNESNKKRYKANHSYNKTTTRQKMIDNATNDTFGFDCVNLIKAILWGWNGDLTKTYGGASYGINNVPDTNADGFIKLCNPSTNFKDIVPGSAVWMKGHIGVYIGNGEVIESSPKWKNGVQKTYLGNLGYTNGNSRVWTSWGKIPFIDYSEEVKQEVKEEPKKEVKVEQPKSAYFEYKVQKGDTLSRIASRYSTTVNKLAKDNGIKNVNLIRVGQIIKIYK